MKLTWKVALGALIVAGIIWAGWSILGYRSDLREWKQTAERFENQRDSLTEETERWEDSAQSAAQSADSARKAVDSVRNRAESRIREAREAGREAREIAEAASTDLDSAFHQLETAIIEEKPKKVQLNLLNAAKSAEIREDSAQDAQIQAKNRVIAEKNDVIAAQDTLIEKIEQENAVKDSVNASLRRELAESEEQREMWREEAKPDLFDMSLPRIGRDLLFFAAGRASGEVL